jgi:hypothetical protein
LSRHILQLTLQIVVIVMIIAGPAVFSVEESRASTPFNTSNSGNHVMIHGQL